MALTLRPVHERDLERAGDVNFLAFYHAALSHGLAPGLTGPNESRRYLRWLLGFDPLGGTVAEEDGEVIGVAWVHPRGPVATVGPLAAGTYPLWLNIYDAHDDPPTAYTVSMENVAP